MSTPKGQIDIEFERYSLNIGDELTKEQEYESTPEAYKVEKATTASGIIVYGFYNGKWIANPNCRALIAHLLNMRLKENK